MNVAKHGVHLGRPPAQLRMRPDALYELTQEQPDVVTCDALHMLVDAAHLLLRNLKIALIDYRVAARKELVCALDFSEFHTYVWPYRAEAHNAHVTKALLETHDLTFTLPPGAVDEFIRHLRRTASSASRVRRDIQRVDDSAMGRALLAAFKPGETDLLTSLIESTATAQTLVRSLHDNETTLHRLLQLDDMPNLRSFAEFLHDAEPDLRPNDKIFHQILTGLSLRRPLDYYNNLVDAHNYALIWALSDAHHVARNRLYVLVTSSPNPLVVCRQSHWPWYSKAFGEDLSLVRHPIQTLYLARALGAGKHAGKILRALVSRLEYLIRNWTSVAAYQHFVYGQLPPDTPLRLPQSKRYVKTLLSFRSDFELFMPARRAIESDIVLQENMRRARNVSPWAVSTVTGQVDGFAQMISTRIAYNVFDKITQHALRFSRRLIAEARLLPKHLLAEIDTEGVLTRGPRLKVTWRRNDTYDCDELHIATHDGALFLAGDVFASYYSLSWLTRSNFVEFVDAVRRVLSAYPTVGSERDRAYTGVDVFVATEVVPMHADMEDVPNLNADDILALAQRETVELIRISTCLGDFYYEFQPLGTTPQRCGVVSHVPMPEQLTWLVWATNRERAAILDIRRNIDGVLNCYGKDRTTQDEPRAPRQAAQVSLSTAGA